jgi:large subunit ribosomal protein L9|tara:strand:- start:221 stop:664 length:444 start_codon:yes stop_codon:yes gene_type:complete
MKIILTTNIKKLGKVGDLVNVKDGYARNFLLPQKKALRETEKNKKHFEKIKEDINKKENQKKDNALKIIEQLKKLKIEFSKESDEKDQLYGTVSKKEILNFLVENNINIMSDDIKIIEPIRSIGEHLVEINPYEGLIEKIKVFIKRS